MFPIFRIFTISLGWALPGPGPVRGSPVPAPGPGWGSSQDPCVASKVSWDWSHTGHLTRSLLIAGHYLFSEQEGTGSLFARHGLFLISGVVAQDPIPSADIHKTEHQTRKINKYFIYPYFLLILRYQLKNDFA